MTQFLLRNQWGKKKKKGKIIIALKRLVSYNNQM